MESIEVISKNGGIWVRGTNDKIVNLALAHTIRVAATQAEAPGPNALPGTPADTEPVWKLLAFMGGSGPPLMVMITLFKSKNKAEVDAAFLTIQHLLGATDIETAQKKLTTHN